jgi:hypothetical protein
MEDEQLAEHVSLRQRHDDLIVRLTREFSFDERDPALGRLMGQPVEIHSEGVGPVGLVLEAGGADLPPGAHQIVHGEARETRFDFLSGRRRFGLAAGGVAKPEHLVTPAHRRVVASRPEAHKARPNESWGKGFSLREASSRVRGLKPIYQELPPSSVRPNARPTRCAP